MIVEIKEPSVLIRINIVYAVSMTPLQLYEYTRGQWKVNPERAKEAKFAFAIYKGLIKEVYTILNWYEAGQTFSIRTKADVERRGLVNKNNNRYEFVRNIAPKEIRDKYLNKSAAHYFKKGASNPIMYLNL